MEQEKNDNNLLAEFSEFIDSFKSTQLATVDENGLPHASYAPVLRKEHCFYIYVSGLARHTRNLESASRTALLFVEDESSTSEIFARRRATFDCRVLAIPRDTPTWKSLIVDFYSRFGTIMNLLRDLPDFQFFKLKPISAIYVKGFGKTFTIGGNDLDLMVQVVSKDKK
jgi:putative heme iron utilization protein